MKNITQERLIELAEGMEPTAEESRLLEASDEYKNEFAELKSLFHDLRAQPDPELDARALAGILPAVRAGIERHSRRSLFARFAAWQPANNALAVAASLLILFGLMLTAPGSLPTATDQDLLSYGFASAQLADPSFDVGVLQLEAEDSSDFELFGEFESALDSSDSIELLDESTFDLMDRATDLDKETFDSLKEYFAANL